MAKTSDESFTLLVPKGQKHPIIGRSERLASRRLMALELRKSGYTYEQIITLMRREPGNEKYGMSGLCRDLRIAMGNIAKAQQKAAEDIRQMEILRLDAMLVKLNAAFHGIPDPNDETKWIVPPDVNQTANIIRVMDRRAKLLGLDAPDTAFLGMQITTETVHRTLNETQNIIDSPVATRKLNDILLALNNPR